MSEKPTKEHGILFTAPMVRALLDGRKTQTRRIVKLKEFQPSTTPGYDWTFRSGRGDCWQDYRHKDLLARVAPHKVGQRIWVKETWHLCHTKDQGGYCYRADSACDDSGERHGQWIVGVFHAFPVRWKPSIHMPRWASRITRLVTEVRIQRVQDISEEDAIAEGIHELWLQQGQSGAWWTGDESNPRVRERTPINAYRSLWEFLYGPGSWALNPWIWAYTLEEVSK